MTKIKLRYVHRFKDRHGRVRHYFRRPGFKRVPLPGEPGSEEFMDARGAGLRSFGEWNRVANQAGRLANKIMRQPAQTAAGALIKVKIVHAALGSVIDPGSGDTDLANYEGQQHQWLRAIIRDLERLAGPKESETGAGPKGSAYHVRRDAMTSTPETIRERLDKLNFSYDDPTNLLDQLGQAAHWRLQKAEEYPDDKRNMEAAEELTALAESTAALGSEHPLVMEREALIQQAIDQDATERLVSMIQFENETLRSIGFQGSYETAEVLLSSLIEGIKAVGDK